MMRLVAWNCAGNLHGKIRELMVLRPDIAVIAECEDAIVTTLKDKGYSGSWTGGSFRPKGLGVFWKDDWIVSRIGEADVDDIHDQWIVPYSVRGPINFTLIAIWSHPDQTGKYIRQLHKTLKAHPEWFEDDPVVLAGDFNSNCQWDKKSDLDNHFNLVEYLKGKRAISAYHWLRNEEQGKETLPTYYHRWKVDDPFHIDYIFLPEDWMSRAQMDLGAHQDWLKHSDHCPLTVEIL